MQPLNDTSTDLPDLAGVRAYVSELEKRFTRLREEGPKLQDRLRSLQVTEKSRDGLITATVGVRGELVKLELDPRIYQRPDARALAEQITRTAQKAGAKAREQVVDELSTLLPRKQVEAQLSGDLNAITEVMNQQIRGEE